jgi:hypothetical protein
VEGEGVDCAGVEGVDAGGVVFAAGDCSLLLSATWLTLLGVCDGELCPATALLAVTVRPVPMRLLARTIGVLERIDLCTSRRGAGA